MAITAALVKELRETTGLGMMACKKALEEADGNMEKAIENLRKQGKATAAKRAGKAAKEGKVTILTHGSDVVMYEVNSETDFVARNEDFVSFVDNLGPILLASKPANMDAAQAIAAKEFGGRTVGEKVMELVGKIGENISFRRFKLLSVDSAKQRVFTYVHGNGRIGVLVTLTTEHAAGIESDVAAELGKDLAMQVAAGNPMATGRDGVSSDLVAKEREIYLTQAQSSGKPEKIWEKIVEGKMSKFYKEVVLVEQAFIRDPDISVADRIKQAEKACDSPIAVLNFTRFELGAE